MFLFRAGVLAAAWLLLGVAPALATPDAPTAGPTSAAPDAQPGLERVGIAEPALPTLAATAGYGVTEAQGDGDGAHHRASLRLAAATAVLPWLNLAPALHGRYDAHPSNGGFVLDGALGVRAVLKVRDLRLGAELEGWLPGSESWSTMFRSASLDARGLVGGRMGRLVLAGSGGYRFDRSAKSGEHAARLGLGDRLALGVSDFDAVLLGVGAGMRFGAAEVIAEGSADLLVGSGAPAISESPLRVAAGGRLWLSRRISASLGVEVTLSGRPELLPSSPLVPVEPRVTTTLGVRYVFFPSEAAVRAHSARTSVEPAPVVSPPLKAPSPVSLATIELHVGDESGAPVPGVAGWIRVGEEKRALEMDETGRLAKLELPPGEVTIHVEAPGFEPVEQTLTLVAGAQEQSIRLIAVPPPSQLRGVVRSLSGRPVVAKIRVEPSGLEAATDATGAFQLDVPPGAYEVLIEANGYRSQRRKVQIDPQGVVILNADLVKRP